MPETAGLRTAWPAGEQTGVLVVNGCLPPPFGGIATFLSGVLPALAENGVHVIALMPRGYSDEPYEEYRARGVEVVVPRRENPVLAALRLGTAAWRYRRELWRRCVHHRLPLLEALNQLHVWVPAAERILRAHGDRVRAIHAYDAPWAQGWIAAMLARRHGKRFVMSTFGEMAPHQDPVASVDALSRQYVGLSHEVLAAADDVVAPSRFCARKLSFVDIDPEQATVVYPVFGLDAFATAPANRLPAAVAPAVAEQKRPMVLFAGQLQPRKGAAVLVAAAPRVRAAVEDAVFVFAGPDFGSLADLREQAAAAGVANACVFTGAVSDEELRTLYRRADAFVFPTVSDIECLGLSFIQAMYVTCPVVASRVSAVPEVIADGKNGLLFEPGDDAQLASHLVVLLQDGERRKRLAESGATTVRALFDDRATLDRLVSLYS